MAVREKKRTPKAVLVTQQPSDDEELLSIRPRKRRSIPHNVETVSAWCHPSTGSESTRANSHSTIGAHVVQVHIDNTMACTSALHYVPGLVGWEGQGG